MFRISLLSAPLCCFSCCCCCSYLPSTYPFSAPPFIFNILLPKALTPASWTLHLFFCSPSCISSSFLVNTLLRFCVITIKRRRRRKKGGVTTFPPAPDCESRRAASYWLLPWLSSRDRCEADFKGLGEDNSSCISALHPAVSKSPASARESRVFWLRKKKRSNIRLYYKRRKGGVSVLASSGGAVLIVLCRA